MASSSEGRTARWYVPWLLLVPGLAWLVIFFLIPLVSLGRESLRPSIVSGKVVKHVSGLGNFRQVFSDNSTVIGRTFVFAAIATLLCLVIGYPLAYFIAMRGGRSKNLLLALVVLPFFTTYLIRTLSWKILLFGGGPVTHILRGMGLLSKNGEILNTNPAVIGALVYNFLPFMVLPIYVSLEKVDRRLLEAAPDLYSAGWRTFRKVTLPLSIPGVFAGSLLVFIPACGDFVNADLLGGSRQTMIGNIIENNFGKDALRPGISALSFVLMASILIGVLIYARLLGTEDLV
jgi:spermidine/putrescine transport system permease protein